MPSITGFTKDYMDDIKNSTWVSCAIIDNHLIITREDGIIIDCGDVEGDMGPAGLPGSGDAGDIADALELLARGAWVALPFDATKYQAYESATYGIPRYSVGAGRIYFAGALQRTAASITGTVNDTLISPYLPAPVRPLNTCLIPYMRNQNDVGDLRYYPSGNFAVQVYSSTGGIATGAIIFLNGCSAALT